MITIHDANMVIPSDRQQGVRHHMDEEEQEWFPKVRSSLSRSHLQEMGARMLELRPDAPTSPAQPSNLKKAVNAVLN